MRLFNVIKVTGRLLYNAITRHNRYVLKFNRENDGVWYIDIPGWPFKHHNLAMVGGADKLCTYLAQGSQSVIVEVIATNHRKSLPGYGLLTKTDSSLLAGADYEPSGFGSFTHGVWICPVTLFVLGRYPKYIFISRKNLPSQEYLVLR